jgi:hypothetical protein
MMLPDDFKGVVDLNADDKQVCVGREVQARAAGLTAPDGGLLWVILLEHRLSPIKDPSVEFDVTMLLTADDIAGLLQVLTSAMADLTAHL